MTRILIGDKVFEERKFNNEAELESVVVKNSELIFGKNTIYFDIKRRVTSPKGSIVSIPDGYVLDFSEGTNPKLWVLENEIHTHDIYNHIITQLARFSSSFKKGTYDFKEFLLAEIKNNKNINDKISRFLKKSKGSNVSELLDFVIFEQKYDFVVVIDEVKEELTDALKGLGKQPEIIEIKKYANVKNPKELIYQFSELQEEIKEAITKKVKKIADVNTIVCPAAEEGFKEVFLKQNKWYAIRMSPSIIPQIKYIAMYEKAPISAIRWLGEVESIKPYKNTGKYEVILIKKSKLNKPIRLASGEGKRGLAPQGPRYTKLDFIKKAKKLSDIF